MKRQMTQKEAQLRQQIAALKAEIDARNTPEHQAWLRTEATPAHRAELEKKEQQIQQGFALIQQIDDFHEAQARLVEINETQFSQELH